MLFACFYDVMKNIWISVVCVCCYASICCLGQCMSFGFVSSFVVMFLCHFRLCFDRGGSLHFSSVRFYYNLLSSLSEFIESCLSILKSHKKKFHL